MSKKLEYLYNERTRKLHIKGGCRHSTGRCSEYKTFKTEDDVRSYSKGEYSWCCYCVKQKEKMMNTAYKNG